MTNRPDYDFSKHVKVPDAWIERALAVPSAQARKPHRFSLRSRRLAAAAAVVLVLGMSISLYFIFRNIDEPTGVVVPSVPSTVTQPTEATAHPTETDVRVPASHAPTAPPTEVNPDSPTAQTPTQPSPTVPSASASEPAVPPVTVPSAPATVPPEPATQPPEPHTDAPVPPTEKPAEEPVSTPENTPTSDRSAEICHPLGSSYVGSASEDDAIYCRLYDLAGNPIGSPNPFAAEHRAEIVWLSPDDVSVGSAYLYYAFSGTVETHPSEPLRCIYVFYDRNGFEIARGSMTL